MKYKNIHPWNITYDEAIEIQKRLSLQVIPEFPGIQPKLIAGADVSYSKGSNLFFSGVVVLKMPGMDVVEEVTANDRVNFPYIPGLLSFREAPVLIKAFEKLRNDPDIVIFDGQGIAHPRMFGIASHLGLILNLPSIGCAKKLLAGKYEAVGSEIGENSPIVFADKYVGAVVRTKRNVSPVFVSPGHKMDIASAIEFVMKTCKGYRLPEPTRLAHLLVNRTRADVGI